MTTALNFSLGEYSLDFDETGKLAELLFSQKHSLLNKCDYRMDIGEGKFFIPFGWDECFPTIESHNEFPVMGILVRNKPELVKTKNAITQIWKMRNFQAVRVFSVKESNKLNTPTSALNAPPSALEMRFSVKNTGDRPVEFLWASHSVFGLDGMEEIILSDGKVLSEFSMDGSSSKTFSKTTNPLMIKKKEITVTMETDQPFWGIWFNRGGWPEDAKNAFVCIGIEATNCDSDSPKGTMLATGETFEGRVEINVIQNE